MGLFKPAWQSKNELRALGAIGKVSDLSVLAEIAQNAPLAKIREVAAERKKSFEQYEQEQKMGITFRCPMCGAITQGIQRECTNCNWNGSICPHASGFSTRNQLFEKCSLKTGNNDCSANPYGYGYEDCPIFAKHPYDGSGNEKQIAQSIAVAEVFSQDVEKALGRCGLLDKNVLSSVMTRITDQKHLEIIATSSNMDQARMWAAVKLNDKNIANSVYGALRYSDDALIRIVALQEYKEPQ